MPALSLSHTLSLPLSFSSALSRMKHSLALRLSLWGRSTRIYECANVYDNFAHKCKLLPPCPLPCSSFPLPPLCSSRSTDAAVPHTHPPQLCGKPSEREGAASRRMQSKSKMRVHILHGIPQQQQQQQHHVASYSLSHTQRVGVRERVRGRGREAERILYLKLHEQPHLSIAPGCHSSLQRAAHTHTHTLCTFSQFSQTVRHNCLCTPYTPTPIFFWYLQCFIVAAIFGSSNVIWVSSQLLA